MPTATPRNHLLHRSSCSCKQQWTRCKASYDGWASCYPKRHEQQRFCINYGIFMLTDKTVPCIKNRLQGGWQRWKLTEAHCSRYYFEILSSLLAFPEDTCSKNYLLIVLFSGRVLHNGKVLQKRHGQQSFSVHLTVLMY